MPTQYMLQAEVNTCTVYGCSLVQHAAFRYGNDMVRHSPTRACIIDAESMSLDTSNTPE